MIASYFDIIILLLVVVVIYQKLKSLLGTRPEGIENTKISEENAAKIIDIIMHEAEKQNQTVASDNKEIKEINLSDTDKELQKIPGFDKKIFINSAKRAFEIILEAFGKGDIETLEMLVNKNVLKKFQEIIEQRRAEGITSETDFIGFDKADIIDVKINKNNIAKITVDFVSQQVNLLKDKAGTVIEGDEQYIQSINDKWTFEKALTSTNPNWMLVSTKK